MSARTVLVAIFATQLIGCATHSEVVADGVRGSFRSMRTPMDLAVCIDRNADSFAFGSLRSKVVNTGKEPLEVVILNGAAQWAIVHIRANSNGSAADFYLGGSALLTPQTSIEVVTKGCG